MLFFSILLIFFLKLFMNGGWIVSTGIIRRIDELGRIVIPKEIRKNLRIKNGDNLEILVDGDNIT